jgi:phosphoserine phosphatase
MYGTTKERTVSIGNSFTDIPMFKNSGMSIAFNPTDPYTSEAATYTVRSDNIADVLDYILEE